MSAHHRRSHDSSWQHDLAQVRCPGVCFYVLKEGDTLYLIDTGFFFAENYLQRALVARGWQHLPVRGILLTHGHIDHIWNAAHFAQRFGAWIAAPAADADYYEGELLPEQETRPVALVEYLAKQLLSFRPFRPDLPLVDSQVLPLWQGLHVISLPGHTAGHVASIQRSISYSSLGTYSPVTAEPLTCLLSASMQTQANTARV
jgi:glyoxylase-like metal-dependent hydrolase (beta-lactamase superfamily II)